jgi:hypothetical protein
MKRTEVLVKTEPFYPRKRLDHDVERVLSTPLSGPESLLQASDPMVRKLSGLRPDQVLSIWSRSEMPMVRMAVEDYIKARWVHEKSQWEQALVEATRSSEDVSTLNALATLADRLLTETTQRVDLADHLVSAATTDRHLLLAARLSGSHASRELTQKLWERKTAEALEGLGHVIRPGVRRALIVAYRRTRDVRFMNELRELPR